jgi:Na+(H+)/acetate symporter ActP
VNWAIGIIGSFYILTAFLGFGAAALVGHQGRQPLRQLGAATARAEGRRRRRHDRR